MPDLHWDEDPRPDDDDPVAQAAYDALSDEIVTLIYEDALADEEPWAIEAYEYRRSHSS